MELRDFLQSATSFRGLTAKDIHSLEDAFSVGEYPDGHVFIKEGNKADALHVVIQGEVAARHKRANQPGQLDIKRLRPGEIFGLMSLISNRAGKTSCVAVGTVQVATLPNSAFKLLYEADSPLPHHFQHIIARQLARDCRNLTEAMHHGILPTDEGDASLETPIEYLGPERRTGIGRRQADRRKSNNRNNDRRHTSPPSETR